MGDLIANFEGAQANLEAWKREIEGTMRLNQMQLNEQLQQIRSVTEELQSVMTEAGVARWRIAAESALSAGKEHLRAIEAASTDVISKLNDAVQGINLLAKKSFDRLDRASAYTIKHISDAISSFRIGDFQRLADQSREIVEETSTTAIKRLKDTVRWFQWKNIGLALAMTVFATFTIGLYLNDELPWEIHKQVVAQRNACLEQFER
jgi:hypothetical protein